MKNLFSTLSLLTALLLAGQSKATLVVTTLNQKLDSAGGQLGIKIGNNVLVDAFILNYFQNGAFTITGKLIPELDSKVLVKPVGGGNYTPVKIYNNDSTFYGDSNWQRSPIFLYSASLSFVSEFYGKGNQYISLKVKFDSATTVYAWILINLDSAAHKITVLKSAYEDNPGHPAITGTEGDTKPIISTGTQQLHANPQISVYPQPARYLLNVQFAEEENMELNYELHNLNGELIDNGTLKNLGKINVSMLNPGFYLLTFFNEKTMLCKKILIE